MQYFGADALGSVRQIYNSSGQIIANKRYDPYGNVLSEAEGSRRTAQAQATMATRASGWMLRGWSTCARGTMHRGRAEPPHSVRRGW